ncbi:hypothetical protein B0T14DRAFT_550554 [Immersiella caudata]|uniref:Uncharacterized protein n=1 Tax=Immersiella caudata TaxID=314043 RepID=A0AA40CDA9_9PEZI|nr:hypothetical protein B0T14DRAFT_550554 [Immersiella caudata]
MFGSRRQRPNPPPTSSTADPNAATAAAAVFKRHESNSSLSAAAAAAALAARPTTPTRVADVQTKRTMRRSASIASSAASSDNHERPGLQRRGSSGSMTERTFRSPSPHRPTSSGSAHRQSQSFSYTAMEDTPPVPALPRGAEIATHHVPRRRATSSGVNTTPLRLASQILASDDTPSWFGASKMGDLNNVRRTDPAMASPPSSPPQAVRGEQQTELVRSSSRSSSVNFSYPSRARVGSPTAPPAGTRNLAELQPRSAAQEQTTAARQAQQPRQAKPQPKKRHSTAAPSHSSVSTPADEVLVYDPNSRRMVRQADLWTLEQAVRHAMPPPINSKRKKQTPQRAGSHLAKGTMGRTRINAPAVEQAKNLQVVKPGAEHPSQGMDPEEVEEPAVKTLTSSPKIEPQQNRNHAAGPTLRSQFSDPTAVAAPRLDSTSRDLSQQTVKRQPSVVKEEPELEFETENDPQMVIGWVPDTVPAAQRSSPEARAGAQRNLEQAVEVVPSFDTPVAVSPPTPQEPIFAAGIPQSNSASLNETHQSASEPLRLSHAHQERATSSSPVRQAHFGSVSNNLTVRHSPPPRSISPRKSALKHSSSPNRGASPSDDTSEASGGFNSREESPIVRKKSVRVSFDDGNTVVVGESASTNQSDSPVFASPQHTVRRPWYSSIGRSKKELPPLDDDEIMKPRPALPSFGSVRDRKPRESPQDEGERPLVRPIVERLHGSTAPNAPSGAADDGKTSEAAAIGQSSDFAVGAILAREQEERSKVPANTSRYREPLPPVVTSVEGSGYMSDSSTSSSSELESQGIPEEAAVNLRHSATVDTDPIVIEAKPAVGPIKLGDASEMAVPAISISQPTPPVAEKKPMPSFFLDVPGGFPQDDSDLSAAEGSKNATIVANGLDPTLTPPPPGQSAISSTVEPSSDSESSIYSDAYEDLSEIEGDGFQSLNAVLETSPPVKTSTVTLLTNAGPQQSSELQGQSRPDVQAPASSSAVVPPAQPTEPAESGKPEDEWEKVKAYWKNLTADKRAQLEREATEDAGIEGDLEEVQAVQKPKKKKSVERRNSERKALAVHMAQQMVAQQQKQAEAKPVERNYMIQPGTKWAEGSNVRSSMQTTLRGQPPQQLSAATSNDAPRLRKSMRINGSSANGAAQSSRARPLDTRPASMVVPPTSQHQRASEPTSQHSHRPLLLRRRGSTSSESSFKRTRPGIAAHVSGFRTSMRQASSPSAVAQPEQRDGKRFSLRSLSPPNSALKRNSSGPPVSMGTGTHMRQTLRDSSSERKKSSGGLRLPGFGSKKAGKHSGTQFSSRFGDSSDDDGDGGKSGFRSRFEDSSDDEAVSPVVLPKSIPRSLRPQDSVASTALPEELEESEEQLPGENSGVNTNQERVQEQALSPVTQQLAAATVQPVKSGSSRLVGSQTAPALLTTGTTKVTERRNSVTSKRGSLMTALRRKKHNSSGKISRPGITESAARRDTKLERNLSQLRGIRSDQDEPEIEDDIAEQGKTLSPPRSPRLQKRVVSLARSMGNTDTNAAAGTDLPLPLALTASPAVELPSATLSEKEFLGTPIRRPNTRSGNLGTRTLSGLSSVGVGVGAAPPSGFLKRRTLSAGITSLEAPSAAGASSTKKKKFGALRRMFGLAD